MLAAGFIVMLLIGFIGGLIIGNAFRKTPVSGTLRVDSSDPDGPYLFLELEENVDIVKRKDCVTLKVDNSGYLSQK